MKVLMVCLGNICRSPLAEGILKTKLIEKGLHWQVDSAGTGAWHVGEKPDRRSIQVASKNGIDITDQRARKFSPYDLENFDLIYAMDEQNYRDIQRVCNSEKEQKKVKMILNETMPGEDLSVPDPYYGVGDEGFVHVFKMLDQACDRIIDKYR